MIRSLCLLCLSLGIVLTSSPSAADSAKKENSVIRRFALIVGANNGGDGRVLLQYAGTDASRLASVVQQLGGVSERDMMLVSDSSLASLEAALTDLESRLRRAARPGVRVEVLFYYSGHSDETGLLLGGQRYSYSALRAKIASFSAEVKIAILDSCASGAFTRAKGGTRRPAFLVDASSRVKGYAFIASSSATEVAQESDRISSSFFTYYFISGLRGGADSNRDGRVTLNEAYQYAFNETVAHTEQTQGGAQHPAYNMHLVGTGDVVISDLRATSVSLVLAKPVLGRIFIRDASGALVLEINKKQRHPMTLGLAPGRYAVLLSNASGLFKAEVVVAKGKPRTLRVSSFKKISGEATVSRGGALASADKSEADYETAPVVVSFVPGLSTVNRLVERKLSLNILAGRAGRIDGFEIGGLVNLTKGRVVGVQLAGITNLRGGALHGVALAGVANLGEGGGQGVVIAGVANLEEQGFRGIQAAGVANYSPARVSGAQLSGVTNYSSRMVGMQVSGVVNYANEVKGLQLTGVFNYARWIRGAQIGLVNFAGKVHGTQIGLINVAEESDASIGLINVIDNGYRALEGWVTDDSFRNIGYKLGGQRLYTQFSLSQKGTNTTEFPRLGVGFGVHTGQHRSVAEGGRLYSDIDVLVLSDVKEIDKLLGKLRIAIGFRFTEQLSIFGGASLNGLLDFDGQAAKVGLVHGSVRERSYGSYRLGVGAFAGAAWTFGSSAR